MIVIALLFHRFSTFDFYVECLCVKPTSALAAKATNQLSAEIVNEIFVFVIYDVFGFGGIFSFWQIFQFIILRQ